MDNVDELLNIKNQIDKAKTDKATISGKLQQLQANLKKEFNVSTLEEAETKLNELDDIIKEKELIFNKDLEALKSKYDWGI